MFDLNYYTKLFKVRSHCNAMNNPHFIERNFTHNGLFTYQDFKVIEAQFLDDNNITQEDFTHMFIYNRIIDAYFRNYHIGYVNRCSKQINMRTTFI